MEYRGRINGDKILRSAAVEHRVREATEETAARARMAAPVDTGKLKESIRVVIDERGGVKRDRVVGRVIATASRKSDDGEYGYNAAREFGNSQGAGEFYLRRSLPR